MHDIRGGEKRGNEGREAIEKEKESEEVYECRERGRERKRRRKGREEGREEEDDRLKKKSRDIEDV